MKELQLSGVPLSDTERDNVCLLVSEVVTNAVLHGTDKDDPHARLTVEADVVAEAGRLRIAVVDPGRGMPEQREAGEDAEDGRGLLLVNLIAAAHGAEKDEETGGTRVWFELDVSALALLALEMEEEVPRPVQDLARRAEIARRISSMTAHGRIRMARPVPHVGTVGPRRALGQRWAAA